MIFFDLMLLSALVGVALFALTSGEPRRGVILFIVFGLLVALVWARLGAVDVALAEAAIGAGIGGALLLKDAMTRERATAAAPGGEETAGDPR